MFVDVAEGVVCGWTKIYDGYDYYKLAYSPDGVVLAAVGCMLDDSLDGFMFTFDVDNYAKSRM